MHGSTRDLPAEIDVEGVTIREAEWGEMNVSLEAIAGGTDTAPLFVGLPDDRCQCPHWGYLVKGRFRVVYKDREETVSAGDAYYLPPGHTVIFDEDSETIEFSPKGDYQKTIEVAAANFAAMMAQAPA
jgi:hypothetical protein